MEGEFIQAFEQSFPGIALITLVLATIASVLLNRYGGVSFKTIGALAGAMIFKAIAFGGLIGGVLGVVALAIGVVVLPPTEVVTELKPMMKTVIVLLVAAAVSSGISNGLLVTAGNEINPEETEGEAEECVS